MANNESDERRAKLEAAYETQKAVFDSALSHYLVADGGRNVQKFGSIGKEATYADFQTALNNDSNIASSFLNADNKAGELYGGAVTSLEVLQRGAAFYATSAVYAAAAV